MDQATQGENPPQLLLRAGVRLRRDTLRADLFAGRGLPTRTLESPSESRGYRTPEWLERSFVLPVQSRASWPSAPHEAPTDPGVDRAPQDFLGLAARIAEIRRPAQAAPIDFCALVRRGEVFRRVRAGAFACAILALAILLAYALTGLTALLPPLFLVVSAGAGASYAAMHLANAPLPRTAR
jgi:hypothetical protein